MDHVMSEPHFPPIADGGPDDLPRTLRREREAREREAREREQAAAAQMGAPYGAGEAGYAAAGYALSAEDAPPARVTRLDVPFLHLVTFFLKAALAAIPGLLLLGAILWALGHLAQTFFPQLLKMQILIWFPNNT